LRSRPAGGFVQVSSTSFTLYGLRDAGMDADERLVVDLERVAG
jgi:hypothetical protein